MARRSSSSHTCWRRAASRWRREASRWRSAHSACAAAETAAARGAAATARWPANNKSRARRFLARDVPIWEVYSLGAPRVVTPNKSCTAPRGSHTGGNGVARSWRCTPTDCDRAGVLRSTEGVKGLFFVSKNGWRGNAATKPPGSMLGQVWRPRGARAAHGPKATRDGSRSGTAQGSPPATKSLGAMG